jgi:NTE family protein
VKGIAYVGALEVLEREGILKDIKRVAGTSAGALVAVLISLGYTAQELKDILWNINFQNFLDSSWGLVRNTARFIEDYGWYKGEFFRELVAGYIKEKTGNSESTFKDLAKSKDFRGLSLIGSDLSTGYSKVFSNEFTPNVKVADAARISMSIPLFFKAVRGVNGDGHIYVDGGLLDNYAIKVFDRVNYVKNKNNLRYTEYYEKTNKSLKNKNKLTNEYVYNKETLGFRLDAKEQIEMFLDHSIEPKAKDIDSLFSYTKALVTTLIDFQNNVHLHSDDWQRTVYIDSLGISSTDFGISDSKKQKLVDSGILHTQKYLDWYNNDEEKANK